MTDGMPFRSDPPTDRPAPSIPSFFAILREALRLYRRRFWTYFYIAGIAHAAMFLVFALLAAAAGAVIPAPPWLASLSESLLSHGPAISYTFVGTSFLEGLLVPTLVAVALADARGVRVSAPEAFVRTLPRLYLFIIAWIPVSLLIGIAMLEILIGLVVHEPFAAVIAVPAVLLYVGFSLMEPVFVAERRGPLGALWRSLRLSWRRGVWSRLVALMLLPCAVWPVMCWAAIGLLLAYEGPLRRVFGRLGLRGGGTDVSAPLFITVAIAMVLLLPLFMLCKAVIYRHAVLLYPPRVPVESPADTPHVSA